MRPQKQQSNALDTSLTICTLMSRGEYNIYTGNTYGATLLSHLYIICISWTKTLIGDISDFDKHIPRPRQHVSTGGATHTSYVITNGRH